MKTQISRFSLVPLARHCAVSHPKVGLGLQRDTKQKVTFGSSIRASHFWSRLLILSYTVLFNKQSITTDIISLLFTKICYEIKHGRHCSHFIGKETEHEKRKVTCSRSTRKYLKGLDEDDQRRDRHRNPRIRVSKIGEWWSVSHEDQPDQTKARGQGTPERSPNWNDKLFCMFDHW